MRKQRNKTISSGCDQLPPLHASHYIKYAMAIEIIVHTNSDLDKIREQDFEINERISNIRHT